MAGDDVSYLSNNEYDNLIIGEINDNSLGIC